MITLKPPSTNHAHAIISSSTCYALKCVLIFKELAKYLNEEVNMTIQIYTNANQFFVRRVMEHEPMEKSTQRGDVRT